MQRKSAGSAPHDLGSPTEDPFVNVNQYNYQDVSNWRDLNSKYVLMIWRDYVWSGSKDDNFLRYTWSAIKQAMEHLRQYDTDGDGLIKNGGFPDQTYDNWVARGESAYSGSLYLAALRATTEMARKLGETQGRLRLRCAVQESRRRLYQESMEWHLLQLRPGQDHQRTHGRAVRGTMVRQPHRTGRSGSPRDARSALHECSTPTC